MVQESHQLVPTEEDEKPEAVTEAERTIRHLALALATAGVLAPLLWYVQVDLFNLYLIPLSWVGLFLVALVLFFFFPQTRKARLAREILRQWDEVRVKGLLETSGSSTDPRLQAAERMGHRIAHHPGATPEMQRLAEQLVAGLRRATQDQRLIEVLLSSGAASPWGAGGKESMRDSLDYVEARAGDLLGALAELHGVVVRRDGRGVERVLAEAERTLAELEALEDVEQLLDGDES